jgi:orotate phosphoribosyltransferase-like protein
LQYSIDDLVRLAKRDNNNIRPYLYVNPIQGKHIPTDPEDTMMMCRTLANMVKAAYPSDRLFVIGFAETATGIAAGVCHYLDNVVYYQNTTREQADNEEYLYFTESHSHATDQMLRTNSIDHCFENVDRIIFIDDEVTTGNTICKLVDRLEDKCGISKIKYSIASILNSMTNFRVNQLEDKGIECLFISDLPFEYKKNSIMDISYEKDRDTLCKADEMENVDCVEFDTKANVRSTISFYEYESEINRFVSKIEKIIGYEHYGRLLVLGTEECMYPAIRLGEILKKDGVAEAVKVHATTRSPIIASCEDGYPLNHRYQIRSVYDKERDTYVYNLKKYDKVIVVTDTGIVAEGMNDLLVALRSVGNKNILVSRWIYF